jgi:hypothetical protein
MIRLDGTKIWERGIIGGKAKYICLLQSVGLNVPISLVLPIGERDEDISELIGCLESLHQGSQEWLLALRSSAEIEDSKTSLGCKRSWVQIPPSRLFPSNLLSRQTA